MSRTIILDGVEELPELYASIEEDFEGIDYSDWMYRELDLMAEAHRRYFDKSAGPDGAGWKSNAPSTIAYKGHSTVLRGVRGRRAPKLKHTKKIKFVRTRWVSGYRLATSLTVKSRQSIGDAIREAVTADNGGSMTFGSDVEYSKYNNDRPHVGINEQHLDLMTNRAADFTLAQLAK